MNCKAESLTQTVGYFRKQTFTLNEASAIDSSVFRWLSEFRDLADLGVTGGILRMPRQLVGGATRCVLHHHRVAL